MCIITQTTFSVCGCCVDKDTMICGYQDDNLSMCMDLTDIHGSISPGLCGRRSCRGTKGSVMEPLKTQTIRVDVHDISDSGSEASSPVNIVARDEWLAKVDSNNSVISSAAPPTSIVPPV